MVRTRIAPSPTGYAHIGTIYQALFNFAFAKKYQGKFVVRIEDTDQARLVEGAESFIFESLDWVGLQEDESPRKGGEYGPYRQSERLKLYHKYAEGLVRTGHAFFSYFPRKDAGQKKDYTQEKTNKRAETSESPPQTIDEMIQRGDWVVRMKVPQGEVIVVKDELRGEISFPSTEVTEQVLLKSDGFPTYHLAVVVDDHLMKISHIVRAEEWLSSLPKHVLLYKYFGWTMPPIFHTATLRNPDKSKLSKRHGHTNVLWYKEEGYLPEAILNYLAHLGWSHPEEKEIFSLDEFAEKFELKDIRPIAAVFDTTKLTWMNQQYIQNFPEDRFLNALKDFYKNDQEIFSLLNDKGSSLELLISIVKTRMKTLRDFKALVEVPVKENRYENDEVMLAKSLRSILGSIDEKDWGEEVILTKLKMFCEENKVSMKIVYVLLTGKPQGLPLPQFLTYLKREKSLQRLSRYM